MDSLIIEKILNLRINPTTSKQEYLVKWKGSNNKCHKWESEEKLNFPTLRANYLARQEGKAARTRGASTSGYQTRRKLGSDTGYVPESAAATDTTSAASTSGYQTIQKVGSATGYVPKSVAATDTSGMDYVQILSSVGNKENIFTTITNIAVSTSGNQTVQKVGSAKGYVPERVVAATDTLVESKMKLGFAKGYVPECIVAATNSSGPLLFLMNWEDVDIYDLVPAKEANKMPTNCY